MRFNINNIGLVLCVFLLTSCVYTKFEVYKSFENIETDTRYYKVIIGKTKCAKNFRYGFQFLAGKNRSKITKFKHSLKMI